MATVQEEILNAFYAKLSNSESIDETTIDALRKALGATRKLKADDFVAILAKNPTGDRP
jgi:hypothetical protein